MLPALLRIVQHCGFLLTGTPALSSNCMCTPATALYSPYFYASMICPALLGAAQHSGSVRAADQFIPGATVTARQGGNKHVTYTNENGRYLLELTPGEWDIQVEILGFIPLRETFSGDRHTYKDWALEMPRAGESIKPESVTPRSTEQTGRSAQQIERSRRQRLSQPRHLQQQVTVLRVTARHDPRPLSRTPRPRQPRKASRRSLKHPRPTWRLRRAANRKTLSWLMEVPVAD